jgi:hypothetical protein
MEVECVERKLEWEEFGGLTALESRLRDWRRSLVHEFLKSM